MSNSKIEIAQLQQEIAGHLGMDQANIVFDYTEVAENIRLDLFTVNTIHAQTFLFHSTKGYHQIDALKEMLKYTRNYKERESSYTLQWSLKEENRLHTSYFSARNIMEALGKFYFGRDQHSIIVFSVVLNPIS